MAFVAVVLVPDSTCTPVTYIYTYIYMLRESLRAGVSVLQRMDGPECQKGRDLCASRDPLRSVRCVRFGTRPMVLRIGVDRRCAAEERLATCHGGHGGGKFGRIKAE